jgi:hypothetical protein
VFTYYLARQFYDLRLFNEANTTLSGVQDFINCNIPYLYSLKVLIYLANLRFDKALLLVEALTTKDRKNFKEYYIVYILSFYIKIHKLIDLGGDDFMLIESIIDQINQIFEDIEKEYRK